MRSRRFAMTATLLLLPLFGCIVQTHKDDAGGKDVSVSTPLGGMSVKTDSNAVQAKMGLPLYPGATLEQKKGKDDSSADVNMSFGAFHLRVLASGFDSADSPEKVATFYRGALAQYSDVITCRDNKPVGSPAKTGLGLTCSEDNHVHHGDSDEGETQLKAGSPARQHIVAYKPSGGGTHFALISLELPHGEDKGA